MSVLAQQQCTVLHGQIDECLVVCVAASDAGFGGCCDDVGVLVKPGEYVICAEFVEGQADCYFGVGEHSGQFAPHGLGGQPVNLFVSQCLADGFGGWVVEDEDIQDDVGVQDN
jgi:hypothetical protein